ncbi:putative secreted protein [Corynebacterium resistens DSM 45100]|uniref:Secreted protein n=1 Tax=Corynebacterium resistens (strain DSM 45100 / JCM 12819 / GTC 2026 / SICGH 158) TaxID=662755 RepID=F8E1B8_CORRG|nr:hypothetical protein [Corynebacterium resistens]AEI09282.1 putative secreted protein [Corynebacterium resistens DSM 45100]
MKRKLITATVTAVALSLPTAIANAAPAPTTGVELNVSQDQFVSGKATVNPGLGRTEGLQALKDLRAWAWDTNPLFRGYGYENYPAGTRLQDVAKKNGITTKAAYTQIQADENLNWIAIQRAFESAKSFAHQRPDGTDGSTATRHGSAPALESLACGTNQTMRSAIFDGFGRREVAALDQNGGNYSNSTGHAIHVLHPTHKVWGFGQVSISGSKCGNYTAAVNGQSLTKQDTTPSETKVYTLHRTPVPGERPTGQIQETPKPAPDQGNKPAPAPGQAISSDFSSPTAIAGTIIAALTFLGGLWAIIQQFLPRR